MKLETKRLFLRTPQIRDAADYVNIHNSQFVLRFNAMTPVTEEKVLTRLKDPEYLENALFMELKQTGRIIGAIFLEEDSLRWGINSRELSYFIAEDHSRKGYMKEALQTVIGWLFTQEELECVAARSFAPNVASRMLLASLGFHQDGIIPRCVKGYGDTIFDDTLHSLFREDFSKEYSYGQYH